MSEEGAYSNTDGAQPRAVGSIVNNRYRILAVVGRGGLGVVYRVADILYSSKNVYALKELADSSPGARKQFELESKWLQELNHNNIPKVRESFEWDERVYLVMDYVDGENLEQYLRRTSHPLAEDQALQWMLPICDSLQYLHTRTPPLLHRDVKPANIIVTPGGHPVLVDFGIAKAHLPGMNQTVTFVRKAGTEGYAPPEQYAATGLTGPWSDVYGLGATLYQLLTGRVPQTAVERITGDTPMPRPRAINPKISAVTDAAVMRALELKPANRYQTVTEFAAQMMEAIQQAKFASSGPGGQQRSEANGPMSMPPASQRPHQSLPQPQAQRPPAYPFGPGVNPNPMSPQRPAAVASPPPTSLPPLGAPIPSNLTASLPPSDAISGPLIPSAPRLQPTRPASSSTPSRAEMHMPPGAVTATRLQGAQAEKRRVMSLPALIGALVVLMVIIGGAAMFAYQYFAPPDRSTVQASVNGYYNALEQQNYARAWQYTADSRNDPNSQANTVNALSSDDGRYGAVMSFTVNQVQSDNSGHIVATVTVKRAKSPDSPLTYTLSLTEYGGSTWLIDSASSQ